MYVPVQVRFCQSAENPPAVKLTPARCALYGDDREKEIEQKERDKEREREREREVYPVVSTRDVFYLFIYYYNIIISYLLKKV